MSVGDVVIVRLPEGSNALGKFRPALVIAELPGEFPAVLLSGISSRLDRVANDWDVVVGADHPDFESSGLKVPSVIRPSWLTSILTSTPLPRLGSVGIDTVGEVRSRVVRALDPTELP